MPIPTTGNRRPPLAEKALIPEKKDGLIMSGESSASSTTAEKPERAIRKEKTFGEKVDALPKTIMFFLFSSGIFLSAVVLDATGFRVLGGVIGATAIIFMALAALTHVVYFLLGLLD